MFKILLIMQELTNRNHVIFYDYHGRIKCFQTQGKYLQHVSILVLLEILCVICKKKIYLKLNNQSIN